MSLLETCPRRRRKHRPPDPIGDAHPVSDLVSSGGSPGSAGSVSSSVGVLELTQQVGLSYLQAFEFLDECVYALVVSHADLLCVDSFDRFFRNNVINRDNL